MTGGWLNAGLPIDPERNGYSEQAEDYRQTFQPEEGPPIVRDATTAARTRISAVYRLSESQAHALRDFYRSTGARTFKWPVPTWLPESGDSDQVFARFASPPRLRPIGGGIYEASVEILAVK